LFLGFVLAAPVVMASPDDPATPAEVVSAVQRTYGSATSLRADFLQVTKNKAMGTEDRQRGRISLERPRKMRIDMGIPVTSTTITDGKTLWVYNVKEKTALQLPEVGDGAGMGGLLDDLGKVSELFDVTLVPQTPPKPSYTVQLVPKKAGGQVKSLQLTLSKQKHVLQDLVLVDQMDNIIQMSFSMVKMNQDIPDTEFAFVPPAGVTVTKSP
jgi:chaperone LolA